MPTFHVEVTAELDAPAEAVYTVFSDYVNHHPRILPKGWTLRVERGGRGAGTVFVVDTKALGVTRSMRMEVHEPQPGQVLMEADLDGGPVSTFTVDPVDGGRRARVTIATESPVRGGVLGKIEKAVTAAMMRRLYAEELRNVERYTREMVGNG